MKQLDILLDAKMISEEIHVFSEKVMVYLNKEHQIDEAEMEMMIIHLAMATQRIENGNVVEAMHEDIYSALTREENYQQAIELLEYIVSLTDIDYPHSECQYMLLHLSNILKKKNERDTEV